MTRIRHESVEAVKEPSTDRPVSGRTQMKRSGAEWRGRCPFHERTASFCRPGQEGLSCFGCGVGGDVIGFVTETEAPDFGRGKWLATGRSRARARAEPPEADRRRAERPAAPAAGHGRDVPSVFCGRAGSRKRAATWLSAHQPRERRPVPDRAQPAAPDRVRRAALSRAQCGRAGAAGPQRAEVTGSWTADPPAVRARAVRGFGAADAGRPAAQVSKHLDGPVFRKSDIPAGLDPPAARSRRPGLRSWSRATPM
jgi:hypothetical protein